MNANEIIQTVRLTLGLSQDQMAGLLRLNRGFYSMAEIGKRELPTAAFIKVMQIFNTLTPMEPAKSSIAEQDNEPYAELLYKLRERSKKCMRKLTRLREERTLPPQEFSVNMEALAATNHLDEGWLRIIQSNQSKPKAERNFRMEEIALRLQVLSLEAQIAYLEEVMR